MPDETTQKFVENMLKQAKEKKQETAPQSRTEGVDKEKIAEMTEQILGWKKKKQE